MRTLAHEHPILFSGEMVRAILENRKTQTRRVMKWVLGGDVVDHQLTNDNILYMEHLGGGSTFRPRACPYGVSGDRLWVRETFVLERWDDEPKPPTDRVLFHHERDLKDEYDNEYWWWPHYKATDQAPDLFYENDEMDEPQCKWCPSIHMPRWASRIQLEIVKVRVERVQEISQEDAKAEGVSAWRETVNGTTYIPEYSLLWDSINSKRGYTWKSNPWVWVIEFKRVPQ